MALLSEVLRPGRFRVLFVDGEGPEVTRLKRLGLCEQQSLEVVSTGNPLIVSVAGTRLGISRSVTDQISVEPESEQSRPSGEETQ
ncbi:MAG: FeoA family protein [Planctomycetota bacterium]|nr:FeoA family protein [Planctomycetota bacterium]